VFGGIWHHLHGHRWAGDFSRGNLSPEEKQVVGKSPEDLAAERFVEEQLGGVEPLGLLPDDHPRAG
jgi:hypothetical protein